MKTDQEIGQEAAETARQEVLRVANEKGVTLKKIMLRLNQALNAKETKFFQYEGKVTDHKNVIAHGIRVNAVKIALDLHDAMPSQKMEHEHSGTIDHNVTGTMDLEALKDAIGEATTDK